MLLSREQKPKYVNFDLLHVVVNIGIVIHEVSSLTSL